MEAGYLQSFELGIHINKLMFWISFFVVVFIKRLVLTYFRKKASLLYRISIDVLMIEPWMFVWSPNVSSFLMFLLSLIPQLFLQTGRTFHTAALLEWDSSLIQCQTYSPLYPHS